MIYSIKAIPTTYAGVNFRSRLEARWAAFFDLCAWKWDYEPFDLEGWTPDFLIRSAAGPILAEVKPADVATFMQRAMRTAEEGKKQEEQWPFHEFQKAVMHRTHRLVCLLGDAPLSVLETRLPVGFIDIVPEHGCTFDELCDALSPNVNVEGLWREAGNEVQWADRRAA